MNTLQRAAIAIATREADIMMGADPELQAADPRELARAAIGALRDPPDNILSAPGLPYQGNVSHAFGLQQRREAWNKMIDAILAEVPA